MDKKIIFIFILLLLPLVYADDTELFIACGGDDEMIIGCLGDTELTFFSGVLPSGGVGGGRPEYPEEIVEEPISIVSKFEEFLISAGISGLWIYIIEIILILFPIFFFILIFKRRKKKKDTIHNLQSLNI